MIHRVLVANRGEIALRVIAACQAVGCETVLAASTADLDSLPARAADSVICIGPASPAGSYLNIPALITAAVGTRCDALHPGYGFLSESPALAAACRDAEVAFIGPSPEVLEAMGNKLTALRNAQRCEVPLIAGSGRVSSVGEAEAFADAAGLPVIVKAAAGGGGRGMRVVRTKAALADALRAAALEAKSAFGSDELYLERYVQGGRHIEVQIVGDRTGVVAHLGERDCSVQRRHQKMVEEAPAYALPQTTRERMYAAATRLGSFVQYEGVGTVEFLYEPSTDEFFFLEVNARVQVEHPVTEQVTGVDIVAEQLSLAGGNEVSFSQSDIHLNKHAIECRINAESPANNFLPSPGVIRQWIPPSGANTRLDTHCYAGYSVPPYYDSLLGKLICTGRTRDEAIATMSASLARFDVVGVDTTIPFLRGLIDNVDFRKGAIHTRWVEDVYLSD